MLQINFIFLGQRQNYVKYLQKGYLRPSSKEELFMYQTKLIPSIKYMKRSRFESVKSDISNLVRTIRNSHAGLSNLKVRVASMEVSNVDLLCFKIELLTVCRHA